MRIGIIVLILGYILSQFYRAFLAVLAPALQVDIGATPADLSYASGLWFLAFAAMQIPVGEALDRVGPRLTAVALFALGGGGGALVFSMAQSPAHVSVAMVLIGIGCSPILMASYYIFARMFSPAVFGTLAGMVLGFGSFGNIASSAPMAWAADAFGWRGTMIGLAILTLMVAALIWVFVSDPPKVEVDIRGSVVDLLRIRALWPILAMMFVNYAAAAGIRGLWVGPYADEVFHASTTTIGTVSLVMGLAMIAGNFAYGPADRLFKTRKWVVWAGNLLGACALFALFLDPDGGIWKSAALIAAVGFFGASFPLLIAHGRAFFPKHLAGRGVTLMNLFGIAGVSMFQFVTGRIYAGADAGQEAYAPFAMIFLLYAVLLSLGVALYTFSRDRTD